MADGGGPSARSGDFAVRESNQTVVNKLVFQRNRLVQLPETTPRSARNALVLFLRSAFLPEGYPHSVSHDYLEYQAWDSLQALCSSVTGVLSTQALLIGFGVGDSGASAATATVQWLVRDGTGMLGRIMFAYLRGTELDCNAKRWRFMADILNDLALGTDLLAPLVSGAFLPMLCVSSVLKACVGVAGGATRAAITVHQATKHNTADVQAKDGSQETAVGLIGLLLGLVIAPLVGGNWMLLWTCFFLATAMHLYCNYRAVSCCVFDVLNQQRARLVLRPFLASAAVTGMPSYNLLRPEEVARREGILIEPAGWVDLGARASHLPPDRQALTDLFAAFSALPYVLWPEQHGGRRVYGWLKEGCSAEDLLRAFVHAEILSTALAAAASRSSAQPAAVGAAALIGQPAVEDSMRWMNAHWGDVVAALQRAGWKTDRHLLGATEWRIAVEN